VFAALTEKGTGKKDPFVSGVAEKGGRRGVHAPEVACTLEAYPEAKSLSVGFLRNLGLSDLETLKTTVPESVQGAMHAVARLHARKDEPVAPARVAQELESNRSATSRRVHSSTDRGYVRDLKDTPTSPHALCPPLPCPRTSGDPAAPDAPADAYKACERTGETEGIHTPLPPKTTIRPRLEGGTYPSKTSARLHAWEDASKGAEDEGA
jgi:hypothetical protein